MSRSNQPLPFTLVWMMLAALGCGNDPGGAKPSSSGEVVSKLPGVEVVQSSAPKITEEQFYAALDQQLDATAEELSKKKYRSRMQLAAELGQRMQPQRIIREVSKSMQISDVSVLSLFAQSPDVRTNVGERVKRHADATGTKLSSATTSLPMVVSADCREAAAKRLVLAEVAAGKRSPSSDDRAAAPMVGAVLKECQTAATNEPGLTCIIEAKDDAALKACP